jgi:hypothetical protein
MRARVGLSGKERSKYLQNAQDLVKQNHNSEINVKRFKDILIQSVSNNKV